MGPQEPPPPPPMGGYNGKILRVNLTRKTLVDEPLAYEVARRYMGGAGFVAYYLWKELKGGEDALGPENKLIFALGPVTGLVMPGASRYCIGTKSPLTGGIAKTESGGYFMAELKRAGYDAIIVEGKSDKPVYLWVNDGKAVLKDAGHLWGKETKDTQDMIRAELGDEHIQLAMIGQGGENMVRYACIMDGLHDAAGRGGTGAVMGSKNLKAIAARGHKLPEMKDEETIKKIRQEVLSRPSHLSEHGTGGPELQMFVVSGNLPVHNFRDVRFDDAANISSVAMRDTGIRIGMEGCFACPIRCKKIVKAEEPYKIDPGYGGPEYETIASLGSDVGITDVRALCKNNERCNAYSLDTISTGSTIAFAMECYEKGLLTKQDTGGLELTWGNTEAVLKAIDLISRREGIGNLLAEGSAGMAKKIGKGSEAFAMNSKGLEAAMHDARVNASLAIGYAINPHGADHCSSFSGGTSPFGLNQLNQFGILTPVKEEISLQRMALYKLTHCLGMTIDCMCLCMMPGFSYDQKLALLNAVTGWNTGWVELLQISERVFTTMRLFNIREGFTAADDVLPERFFHPKEDKPDVVKALNREKMQLAMKYYYHYMGWDAKGVPTPEKLAELDIK
jgi:aldehyde:ferredoxin oxidoreductase